MYICYVFTVFEDFYVFSNNILCISVKRSTIYILCILYVYAMYLLCVLKISMCFQITYYVFQYRNRQFTYYVYCMYMLCFYYVFEDFYVFSNNILYISVKKSIIYTLCVLYVYAMFLLSV